MSIKDDVMQVSENNTEIAEAMEDVYKAGMRAALLQDPDYSEGYGDGYQQGRNDASGVVWEDLLSGKVSVGRAKEADHAKEADRAAQATRATNADFATSATNATRATSATNATKADSATEATHASEADHAKEADHSAESTHAAEADNAKHADSATSASSASNANTATKADHATRADIANDLSQPLSIEKGGTGATTPYGAIENLGLNLYQKPWDINENIGSIVLNPHESTEINIFATKPSGLKPNETWELVEGWGYDEVEYRTQRFTHSIPVINSGRVYLRASLNYEADNAPTVGSEEEYLEYRVYSGINIVREARAKMDVVGIISLAQDNRTIAIDVTKGEDVKLEIVQRKYVANTGNKVYGFTRFSDIHFLANIDTPYKYFSMITLTDVGSQDSE